jgi:hypothetical protein
MAPDTFNQPATAPDRSHAVVPVNHTCSLGAADRYARERGWDKDPLYVMNDCSCPLCLAYRGEQHAA